MYDVTKGNTGNLCKKQREKMVLKNEDKNTVHQTGFSNR